MEDDDMELACLFDEELAIAREEALGDTDYEDDGNWICGDGGPDC